MHFLVFGATGRTGRAFVDLALAAGHQVSALVRSPTPDLPTAATSSAALHITVGEVTHPATVAALIHPDHTLIVTLGRVDALTIGTANILRAAESAGARRLLGVVGAGILPVLPADGAASSSSSSQLRSDLPTYPPHLRPIGAAHRAFYDAARTSSLDWTLACAPNIVAGPAAGVYRTQLDVLPEGTGTITTGDLAAFLLDEAERGRFPRARVGVTSA